MVNPGAPARFVSEAFRQADFDSNGGIDCVETLGWNDMDEGKRGQTWAKNKMARNCVLIGEIFLI